jgi:hypothetical protein
LIKNLFHFPEKKISQMTMSRIQQETDLIQLLKSINNGSKEVTHQLDCAERRLQDLESAAQRRRERKSFVRRIEQEVGQEKLAMHFTTHGLAHLYHYFKHMTLNEFHRSDPLDWVSLNEHDLRKVLYIK